MNKEFTCPDCGYTWQQGQHGGHSCATWMKKIEEQAREIERLNSDYNEACEDAMCVARELERLNYRYQREVYGLNNEGDPIGGDPAGGYANDNARLRKELSALKAQHEQDAQTIKVLQAMARQLKAQPSGVVLPLMAALESVVHDERVPNEVSQEVAAVLIEARRLNSSPVSAGEPVYQFQCREIGEGDWEPCDHRGYMYCQKSPEMDTRVVQVQALSAPSHGEQVRDWIPVSERLPDRDQGTVAVLTEEGDTLTAWASYWSGASDAFASWSFPHPDDDDSVVTHWMPLLAAPSAGSQEQG